MKATLRAFRCGAILCACLLFCPQNAYAQPLTMDGFIGINIQRDQSVEKMKAVGFVREYHPAPLDQGYPALNNITEDASPVYPFSQYKFNPSYQTQTIVPFDTYYADIQNNDIEVAVSMLQAFPWMFTDDDSPLLPQNPNTAAILEQKPMYPGDDPTDPNSYLAHADWLYQYAARYGNTNFSPPKTAAVVTPRLHPDEVPLTGLGTVRYYENWNEPDKWWYPQYPDTYFTPAEYAVMLSADYDGHQQTMGLLPDPENPGQEISVVGMKNADPTAKMVTAGLSDPDLDYIEGMTAWFEANRDPDGPNGTFPFEVLSIHHYSNTGQELNTLGEYGISPENDMVKQKLLPVSNYRDQHFPEVELWLSEFGYDIDPTSQQRVPWEGIGSADRQEIQAQWIIRSYLEIAASGFDRAMLYELRDACGGDICGLFQASGLTERDYSPRKSWYYVYTLKNVLSGYVYDAELSPCQTTDCAVDCPRVYRFVNPNNPADKVFALWSPTSCDKPAYTYNLDLEGANGGTLIEMNAPSTTGVKTALSGENIAVSVSERPVFIKTGAATNSPNVACLNNLQVGASTCSSVQLAWADTPGISEVDVWTFPAGTTDFDLFHGNFIAEKIPAADGNFTVTGLTENTDYVFVCYARDAAGNVSAPCSVSGGTGEATCKITVNPAWIYDFSGANAVPDQLFDEQNAHDPICDDGGAPTSNFGIEYNQSAPISVSVDLQDYYRIDALYLYDANDFSNFKIEYAASPNGPWQTALDYTTAPFGTWQTFASIFPANMPLRWLRFTSAGDDRAQVGEIILCGEIADFDDNAVPPSPPLDFAHTFSSCNSLTLAWSATFDTDVVAYELQAGGETLTVPFAGQNYTAEISNLNTEITYNVSLRALDADGNYSAPLTVSAATLPAAECDADCATSCACQICLRPSWIQNLTPAAGIDPARLADEQDTNPVCGSGGVPLTEWGENYNANSGVPPMIAVVDLQQCYALSSVHVFDGSGEDFLTIEYKDADDEWQLLTEYLTDATFVWHEFENLIMTTRYLRLTKAGNQAKINEIAVCGVPAICGDCTIAVGTPCNDNDPCTENDVYDENCNCSGTFADADGDTICDSEDLCPTGDDLLDNDNDGTPNACDPTPDGEGGDSDDCDYLTLSANVTDASCAGNNEGAIELNLPNCPGGNGSGNNGGVNENLALTGTASQSSTNYDAPASRANDGNTNGNFWGGQTCSATTWEAQPWWEIDLGAVVNLQSVNVWNRSDCCAENLSNYYILVSETPFVSDNLNDILNQNGVTAYLESEAAAFPTTTQTPVAGRYVRVQRQGAGFLIAAEIEVIGAGGSSGGGCDFTFAWSDNAGDTAAPENLSAGNYQVTVSNTDGCSQTLNVTVGNAENDSDNDGICDSADQCPGADDNADNDNDGIPNGCDSTPDGGGDTDGCADWDLTFTVSDESCAGANDGVITLNLPCSDGGNTGGGDTENLALAGTASQSGTMWNAEADRANDGITNGNFWGANSVTGTQWGVQPWWQIDLGQSAQLQQINIWNRTDCCAESLSNYYVLVSENAFGDATLDELLADANVTTLQQNEAAGAPTEITTNATGRYVRIQLQGAGILSLAEVEIFGGDDGSADCDLSIIWNDNATATERENLAPGGYAVTVTDAAAGCAETATMTVAAGENCTGIVIYCPPHQSVDLPAGQEMTVLNWNDATATTTCAADGLTITQTAGATNGSTFSVGTNEEIIYTASDDCGNTATCSFILEVSGNIAEGEPAPENYCAANASHPWWQWISRVVFADIDHVSQKDGYGNYTATESPVNRGATYTFTGEPDYAWLPYDEHWRVWIDFNRDGDFGDAGELVLEDHGEGIITGDITIPLTASVGKTRMRIAMQDSEYAEPCGSFIYGEVEDYTLDVRAGGTGLQISESENVIEMRHELTKVNTGFSVYPNPTRGELNVVAHDFKGQIMTLRIADAYGRVLREREFAGETLRFDLRGFAAGLYFLVSEGEEGVIFWERVVVE